MTPQSIRSGHSTKEPEDNPCVLVIEDDADIQNAIRELLEDEGHVVATASNGKIALELLQKLKPRVILLDLTMPIMDGRTFRRLQLDDEKLANLPTVVMTAAANLGSLAEELSALAYLPKPIRIDDLERIIAQHCS